MQLQGDLVLSLALGPNASLINQTLELISAAEGVVGQFAKAPSGTRRITQEGNASLVVSYQPGGVFLSGYEAILGGDFDFDGDYDCDDVNAPVADGVVDGSDFVIWNTHKFTSSDTTRIPEPIPLPFHRPIVLAAAIGLWRSAFRIRMAIESIV